jgi:hypothetical protein
MKMDLIMNLNKLQATIKSGREHLTLDDKQLSFTLLDFWRWSVSDILSNATRGRFAEFIVAAAMNMDQTLLRDEWSAYDLESPDGIKIEVKSAAYIQSWFQRNLSKISFSIKPSLHWDSLTNTQSLEKKRHADVYVFCLLHHDDKLTVDPLNMNHWEFYVLGTNEIDDYPRSQHSITLKSLQGLTKAISYDQLSESIREKHRLNISKRITGHSM